MAKGKAVQSGGQVCSDADAAACLAQGHVKSGNVPVKAGMTDQNAAGQKFTQPK